MGILADEKVEEKLARALKFVRVATKDGYLTGVSIAMLMVEMKRSGICVALRQGD